MSDQTRMDPHLMPGWEGMGDDGVRRRLISVDEVPLHDAAGTVVTMIMFDGTKTPTGQFERCTLRHWLAHFGFDA